MKYAATLTALLVFTISLTCMPARSDSDDNNTKPQLDLQVGHSDSVTTAAFSPDGRYLATGSIDSTVKIWALPSCVVQRTFTGHDSVIDDVAFSPDGKYVASTDGSVKVWDVSTGAVLWSSPADTATLVTFTPDSHRLVGAGVDKFYVWDVQTGTALRTWSGGKVTSIALEPDGQHLLSGRQSIEPGANKAVLWDISVGALAAPLVGSDQTVSAVACSHDGKWLATAAGTNRIQIWNAMTNILAAAISVGAGTKTASIQFSPDSSQLLVAEENGGVTIYDRKTLHATGVLSGVHSALFAAYSTDDKQIVVVPDTSTNFDTALLFDPATFQQSTKIPLGSPKTATVVFSPDGAELAQSCGDGAVRIWNTKTRVLMRTFPIGRSPFPPAIAWSPDSLNLAVGTVDSLLETFDPFSGNSTVVEPVIAPLQSDAQQTAHSILSLCYVSPTQIAVSEVGSGIALWDLTTNTAAPLSSTACSALIVSPDRTKLAELDQQRGFKCYDLIAKRMIWAQPPFTPPQNIYSEDNHAAAFSPDGQTFAALTNGNSTIGIYNADDGDVVKSFGDDPELVSIACSPDGKLLATGDAAGLVHLWDPSTGSVVSTFRAGHGPVFDIAFSSDGKTLAAAGYNQTVELFDTAADDLDATLEILPSINPKKVSTDWIAYTPDNYFNCSYGAVASIDWWSDGNVLSDSAYDGDYRRPNELAASAGTSPHSGSKH